MAIFPKRVLDLIDGRFFVWIRGENRSGKTLLALDLASYWLEDGFRFISNLECVWNDNDAIASLPLDENLQLNAVVNLDEGGQSFRTKESIRLVMGYKGKLNSIFLMSSTEAPHEDLWEFTIEPALGFNWILEFLFGSAFLARYCKIWRWTLLNPNPKRSDFSGLFVQVLPAKFWGLYSTVNPANHPENILSQFEGSVRDLYFAVTGRSNLQIQDLASGRSNVEGASYTSALRATKDAYIAGKVSTITKKIKK